ncbi:MAG: hypothetical protein ACQETH_03985 [Candidatus Rifleibacteriota bacterium]
MKLINKLMVFALFVALLFQSGSAFSAVRADEVVTDLTRAYEVWKNQGIKFVVRDDEGKFVTWNIGRLEAWGGKSKWVVRDPKGHFITHAKGNVENWKNGKTRLVLRDSKGRILTHVSIKITGKSSFASNVVGLRHLKNRKFLSFVQDTIADMLIEDIEDKYYVRVRVLLTYLKKYKNDKGTENFKPVLRRLLPKLNFIANHNPENKKIKSLTKTAQKTLVEL